jgi:polyhydroxyalkanoate synthesis regulator phasin
MTQRVNLPRTRRASSIPRPSKEETMTAKSKAGTMRGFAQVQGSIQRLQKEGERLLGRVRKEAARLVSKDQRKVIEGLLAHARRLRIDIQKRAEKAIREVETRAEKAYRQFESQAEKRIEPIVRRFDFASRSDVQRIEKRIAALEKRLEQLDTKAA